MPCKKAFEEYKNGNLKKGFCCLEPASLCIHGENNKEYPYRMLTCQRYAIKGPERSEEELQYEFNILKEARDKNIIIEFPIDISLFLKHKEFI